MYEARDQINGLRSALSTGSPDSLFARLSVVVQELISARRELAQLLAAEHRQKVQAWDVSEETSVQARDRYASKMSLDLTLDIIQLKGDIAAWEDERVLLRDYIARIGVPVVV